MEVLLIISQELGFKIEDLFRLFGISKTSLNEAQSPNQNINVLHDGCSRATSTQNVCIDHFLKNPSKPSMNMVSELFKFKTPNCAQNPQFSKMVLNNESLYCMSLNIRSLKKYEGDVNANSILLQSLGMFFQEIGSKSTNVYKIKDHIECCKINSVHVNGKSSCFIEQSIYQNKIIPKPIIKKKMVHLEAIEIDIENINNIGIYTSLQFPIQNLYHYIEQTVVTNSNNILIGEVKINFHKLPKMLNLLLQIMNYRYKLLTNLPTDYTTILDNIIKNVNIAVSIYELFISNHRPFILINNGTYMKVIKNSDLIKNHCIVEITNKYFNETKGEIMDEIQMNNLVTLVKSDSQSNKIYNNDWYDRINTIQNIENKQSVYLNLIQLNKDTLMVSTNVNKTVTFETSNNDVLLKNNTNKVSNGIKTQERIIHGFINNDNVSCYANSIIQAFYHCESLVKEISNNKLGSIMQQNLIQYNNTQISETWPIRQYLDNESIIFTRKEQQDCVQFLEALMNRNRDIFDTLFGFQEKYTSRCNLCDYTASNNAPMSLIKHLDIPQNRSQKLEQLMNNDQNAWLSILDYRCPKCNNLGGVERKCEITVANEYIIIQLKLFVLTYENEKYISTKISNLKLNGIPDTNLLIAGSKYKPHAAVFHVGQKTDSGHYMTYLRHGHSKWICANDETVSEKLWPIDGKNVYVIIMKRI